MKKIGIVLFCLCLLGCSTPKKQGQETSWVGTYNKDSITLVIEENPDQKESLDFTFTYNNQSISDYAYLDDDNKATCDLGEEGYILTFIKNDDIMEINEEGQVSYINIDLSGNYRRQ